MPSAERSPVVALLFESEETKGKVGLEEHLADDPANGSDLPQGCQRRRHRREFPPTSSPPKQRRWSDFLIERKRAAVPTVLGDLRRIPDAMARRETHRFDVVEPVRQTLDQGRQGRSLCRHQRGGQQAAIGAYVASQVSDRGNQDIVQTGARLDSWAAHIQRASRSCAATGRRGCSRPRVPQGT